MKPGPKPSRKRKRRPSAVVLAKNALTRDHWSRHRSARDLKSDAARGVPSQSAAGTSVARPVTDSKRPTPRSVPEAKPEAAPRSTAKALDRKSGQAESRAPLTSKPPTPKSQPSHKTPKSERGTAPKANNQSGKRPFYRLAVVTPDNTAELTPLLRRAQERAAAAKLKKATARKKKRKKKRGRKPGLPFVPLRGQGQTRVAGSHRSPA
jgi:hypothetical protein